MWMDSKYKWINEWINELPDFDEILKEGSWEHLDQIQTVMVTFVQATFVYMPTVKIFVKATYG